MISKQRIWWVEYDGTDDAPLHSSTCKHCKHSAAEHEDRKVFIYCNGQIIGRKRLFFCTRCDCNFMSYLELLESKQEMTLWGLVAEQPQFEKYGKVDITKEELAHLQAQD